MPYPDSHSKQNQGNYLAVQWLGLRAPTAGGRATVSGQETILLHATQPEKKEEALPVMLQTHTHTFTHTNARTQAPIIENQLILPISTYFSAPILILCSSFYSSRLS